MADAKSCTMLSPTMKINQKSPNAPYHGCQQNILSASPSNLKRAAFKLLLVTSSLMRVKVHGHSLNGSGSGEWKRPNVMRQCNVTYGVMVHVHVPHQLFTKAFGSNPFLM
jgi:hypothetical protein